MGHLQPWLEGRPREVAVAIAARAALRVMPVWAEFCDSGAAREADVTPLPALRAGLISSVAAVSPTDDMRSAARSAHAAFASASVEFTSGAIDTYAAFAAAAFAASETSDQVVALAFAAAHDAAKDAATWDAVSADARAVEDGAAIPSGPLWPGENPLQPLWEATSARWSRPGSPPGLLAPLV